MLKSFNDGMLSLVCFLSLALNWFLADHVRYSAVAGTYIEYTVWGIVGVLAFVGAVNVIALVVKIVRVFNYLLRKAEAEAAAKNTNSK